MAYSKCFLAAAVVVVAFFSLASPVSSDMAFLRKTCRETDHNDVCLAMLLSVRGGINCTDLRCVIGIGISVAEKYARTTSRYIASLLGRRIEAETLGYCQKLYYNVEEDIEDAIQQISSQDFAAADETITSASTKPDSCEAAFQVHPNRMSNSNKSMGYLLDIVWVFLDWITS